MTPGVTHIIPLTQRPGGFPFAGAETQLFTLMEAQQSRGIDVELIVLLELDGPLIRDKLRELEAQGVRVMVVPWRRTFDLRTIRRLRRLLITRRDRIIHTHLAAADHNGKIGAFLARCRYVVSTVHNQQVRYHKRKWRLALPLLNRMTRHSIAISESVRNFMITVERTPPDRITVIPYGIRESKTLPRDAARRHLNLPPDAFVVGFVGRFVPQKNLPLLIEAAARLKTEIPDLCVALVGGGELEDTLRAQVQRLQANNVLLCGYHADGPALMPALDALCLPSSWEGLGSVLIEAMMAGVPVMGSRAGAIPEVLGDGAFGLLFEAGNTDGLAEAIRTLHALPDRGASMADRAREHARATYTVDRMAERTLAVYRDVMA